MVSCPLLPLSVGTDTPGRRRRPLSTLTSSVNLASSGEPLYRRKVYPLLRVRRRGAAWPAGQAVSHAEKNLWDFFKKTLDFIVSIC